MPSLLRRILKYWPIAILFLVELVLFFNNYKPGTYLLGWDNLNPELNLGVAFKRNIFGVWLEYRGLGLYDGMSHAAGLIHTLFVWLLAYIVPQNMNRYVVTFFLHGLGGLGMYTLLIHIFDKKVLKHQFVKSVAVVGSLFYLLNPATIQMFYTPFEPFLFHFAALPWLVWSLWKFLEQGSRKNWLVFLLASLLSTPQFFIPTLLLPIGIVLLVVAISSVRGPLIQSLRRLAYAAIGFLIVNAFWLIPYLYDLPHNAPIIASTKINQISSRDAFERNQAFGDPGNVLLLRGFSLNFTELSLSGSFEYLMAIWRDFLPTREATTILLALLVVAAYGSISILHDRRGINRLGIAVMILFLISFSFLANNTIGISQASVYLRDHFPLLGEAYRFPFTKFSHLFSFSWSLLLAIGTMALVHYVPILKNRGALIAVIMASFVLFLSIPAFQGYFLYPSLRIKIPSQYFDLAAYLSKQNPTLRIATMPEFEYWSWKHYRWGYRGSGFLWHLIPQPLMDRAFDIWSRYNENYYWELSRALYSKNIQYLSAVFDKYDIGYVLLDESRFSTNHNRALFLEDTKSLLTQTPDISFVVKFGDLSLYEHKTQKSHVSFLNNPNYVFPIYKSNDLDSAYETYGDYISSSQISGTERYPFRSLFTKRSVAEREFEISDKGNELLLSSVTEATSTAISKADSLVYESSPAANLSAQKVFSCGPNPDGTSTAQIIEEGGSIFLRFSSKNQENCLSFGANDLDHRVGYLVEVQSRNMSGRPLLFSLINQTAKHVEIESYLPQHSVWQTTYFTLPPLAFDGLGYTVYLSNESVGQKASINEVKSIRFYKFPYQDLVTLRNGSLLSSTSDRGNRNIKINQNVSIKHPNPAYYKIVLRSNEVTNNEATLVLSQSFDPGWTAWAIAQQDKSKAGQARQWLFEALPFLFGTPLKDHVLVNNWANGWELDRSQCTEKSAQVKAADTSPVDYPLCTVYLFFLPQLLEFLGFALLPIPFLICFWPKRQTVT